MMRNYFHLPRTQMLTSLDLTVDQDIPQLVVVPHGQFYQKSTGTVPLGKYRSSNSGKCAFSARLFCKKRNLWATKLSL